MISGRKNLKRVSEKDVVSIEEGQSIMQVVSLPGSNLIEVMDSKGVKSFAIIPARFQRSIWIKKGNFVVVDESGREEALESGSKVACTVTQVLYHNQVRIFEKSPDWPGIFRRKADDYKAHQKLPIRKNDEDLDSNDDNEDDDLPPIEANLNRMRPVEVFSESDADSDSDANI